jgi:hypothetical protein
VLICDVIDEFDTIFDTGCFAESQRQGLPVFAWAHSWAPASPPTTTTTG